MAHRAQHLLAHLSPALCGGAPPGAPPAPTGAPPAPTVLPDDFAGQVALVTGSARGIGAAIATQLAARGARVVVHYNTNRAAAEATLAALPRHARCAGPHLLRQGAVQDPAACERLVGSVVAEAGRLDVLVNNAGVYEEHELLRVGYAEWQRRWKQHLGANLEGPANLCFLAGKVMAEQGWGGAIVNVSSRGAFRGEPECPAYGASKAALNSLSQSLAQYLAPSNVSVGVVAPGFVETEMAAGVLASPRGDAIRGDSRFGRVAKPEEVAQAVVFMATKAFKFGSGGIIDVNGASYLR
jgi:3-oxoacyl-[acyl-carrier protein] reductase